jgi:hypothetical protein
MPVYDTHVIIHLCVLKDFNECSVDTKELRNGIVEETMNVSWLQTGLRKDQKIVSWIDIIHCNRYIKVGKQTITNYF